MSFVFLALDFFFGGSREKKKREGGAVGKKTKNKTHASSSFLSTSLDKSRAPTQSKTLHSKPAGYVLSFFYLLREKVEREQRGAQSGEKKLTLLLSFSQPQPTNNFLPPGRKNQNDPRCQHPGALGWRWWLLCSVFVYLERERERNGESRDKRRRKGKQKTPTASLLFLLHLFQQNKRAARSHLRRSDRR